MKTTILAVFGAFAIACGGTTAPTAQVRTVISPSASLAQYRTFSFGLTEAPPTGYQLSQRSLEAQVRARPLIVAALEEKGYVPQREGERPDLTVRFASDTREAAVRSIGKNPDNPDTVLEGALFIDVFDGATGIEVWHGSALAQVGRDHVDEQRLQAGVRELIARFPDHAMAPAAGARAQSVVE